MELKITDIDIRRKIKVGIGEVRPRLSNDRKVLTFLNSSLGMPRSSTILPSQYHCPASSGLQAVWEGGAAR